MTIIAAVFARPDPAAVVREHGPEVYRLLARIFGPGADVDDAYQNVFVEVLRSLPGFRGRARLSTWIRRIAWNVAYQEMRMAYRAASATSLEDDDLPAGVSPEAQLEGRDELRRLYKALQKLEPKLRLVLVMHDVEGCTLKEIGDAAGRPLPTVASQLAAARAQLARHLSALPIGLSEAEVDAGAGDAAAAQEGSKP